MRVLGAARIRHDVERHRRRRAQGRPVARLVAERIVPDKVRVRRVGERAVAVDRERAVGQGYRLAHIGGQAIDGYDAQRIAIRVRVVGQQSHRQKLRARGQIQRIDRQRGRALRQNHVLAHRIGVVHDHRRSVGDLQRHRGRGTQRAAVARLVLE